VDFGEVGGGEEEERKRGGGGWWRRGRENWPRDDSATRHSASLANETKWGKVDSTRHHY